ncbi:MAG: CoA transferase, partial [Pseudomonadota bacterium]
FRPDVKNRLGVDYESLAAVNPRIILASISGFGQDGPYAKRPGFDQIAQGMGGLMSITGAPGEGPMRVGIPVADLTSGHFTAQAILIALIEREKSGQGQWVHSSLLQAQIAMLDFQASRWLMAQEIAPQTGNEHPTTVPTNLYKCSDGAVNIAVSGDVIWRRLCDALGKPEWADDPRYTDAANRKENRDALNAEIEAVTQTMTMAEVVDTLLEKGVPTGPAYRINEVFADPQVQHLGMAADIDTLPFGKTQMVGQPITMSRTNTSMAAHPPDRGEHTDELLAEAGFDPETIADMRSRNVI